MKNPDSLVNLKKSLKQLPPEELMELVLRLTKYKKENKELLTFLVSYESDAQALCVDFKEELSEAFADMNAHGYYAAKTMRKQLKLVTQFRRFTKSNEYTIDLQAHYLRTVIQYLSPTQRNRSVQSILYRVLLRIEKDISKLHEDLRYDYESLPGELAYELNNRFGYWDDYQFPLGSFRAASE